MDSHPQLPFEKVAELARHFGFDGCAVTPSERLVKEETILRTWIAEGRHGTMEWIEKEPERRCDPDLSQRGCRTIIMLTMTYLREPVQRGVDPTAEPVPGIGRIARYARTRDYHRVIEKRTRKMSRIIDRELAPGARTRGFVDYGPFMERPFAERAGLGFIGKHTLLIDPKRGSYFFLAAILTTAEVTGAPPRNPIQEGCGSCRRCIDACPTGAITEPYRLDARKCLSYLTIEHQGPLPHEVAGQSRGYIFGCDICQDVCPYNQSRAVPAGEDSPLGPLIAPATVRLADLAERPDEFLDGLGDSASPLRRVGPGQLQRNARWLLAAQTKEGTP